MYQTINFSQFCDSFSDSYKNNFTYSGKQALFDYLEEYEKGTGEEVELDPIALCCEYTEYENFEELKKDYPNIENMEDLKDYTQVIEIEGEDNFLIQQF